MSLLVVFLAYRFAVASLASSPAPSSHSTDTACTLSGLVVDAVSGQSVPNVTIEVAALARHRSMTAADLYPGAPLPLGGMRYTALSGGDGRFCFPGLPQGQYVLWARKDGFLNSNYGAASPNSLPEIVDVATMQHPTVTVRMWREATISGAIYNSKGEPLTAGVVEALSTVWFRGRPHIVVVKAAPVTAPGKYNIIGIGPGKYYVRFRPPDSAQACAAAALVQEVAEGFLPTYYPSATGLGEAVPVEVGLAERVSKLDIVARQGATFTVSGRLQMSGKAAEYTSLWLLAQDEEPTAWIIGSSMTDGEGGFRFSNVAPGAYGLFLFGRRHGRNKRRQNRRGIEGSGRYRPPYRRCTAPAAQGDCHSGRFNWSEAERHEVGFDAH